MLPRNQQAVVSVILLNIIIAAATTTTTKAVAAIKQSPKTTTSLLPLQPPLNVTNTTTTSIFGAQKADESHVEASPAVKTDSAKLESEQDTRKLLNDFSYKPQSGKTDLNIQYVYNNDDRQFYVAGSFGNNTRQSSTLNPYSLGKNSTTSNSQSASSKVNNHGRQTSSEQRKQSKAETVNEVLLNLFPNGFSDIFRFSYPTEPSTIQKSQTQHKLQTPSPTKATPRERVELKPRVVQPLKPQAFKVSHKSEAEIQKELKDFKNVQAQAHSLDIQPNSLRETQQQSHQNKTVDNQVAQASLKIPIVVVHTSHSQPQEPQPKPPQSIASQPIFKRPISKPDLFPHLTTGTFSLDAKKPQLEPVEHRNQNWNLKRTNIKNVHFTPPLTNPHDSLKKQTTGTQISKAQKQVHIATQNTSQSSVTQPQISQPQAFLPQHMQQQKLELHPDNKTFYSFESSITKEYRRELGPGHTEIVIEKIHYPRDRSNEFQDGQNTITKEVLLRINRAAEEASVLPSLLLDPSKANATAEETLLSMNGPIVILKDDSAEFSDENDQSTEEDNLIAESQHSGQHVFQRLPEDFKVYPSYKTRSQDINTEVSYGDALQKTREPPPSKPYNANQPIFTQFKPNEESSQIMELKPKNENPENSRISQDLDSFQEHAEKSFQLRNIQQEAPSRKFLKHFDPSLSEVGNGPIAKGSFHYEATVPNPIPSANSAQQNSYQEVEPDQQASGNYAEAYVQPAAQLQYREEQRNQQASGHLHTQIQHSKPVTFENSYRQQYQQQQQQQPTTPAPENLFYITVNTPSAYEPQSLSLPSSKPFQTPHEYVSEAAASLKQPRIVNKPSDSGSYTFVEVQKSINIHNKLIKEQDGKLLEHHETTYYQPQYVQNIAEKPAQPQLSTQQTNYVSLASHPINVQHAEDTYEQQGEEAAASHAAGQRIVAPTPQHSTDYVEKIVEKPVLYPVPVEHVVPQPIEVPVEKIVERPYPVTQIVEKHVPEPYPVREVVEKIVDRPVPVEKVVDRPVEVPYPVPVDHYIDRPYPVQEIVEKHIPMPYPVIEQVGVPVHFDHFIDRPYPVETIVEKPVHVPYPVEKIVEKVVEKHVPVEVERIVEKPVEKIVQKFVDRPIPIPIHVPVGIPMPMHGHYGGHPHPETHEPYPMHALQYPLSTGPAQHPNALGWSGPPATGVLHLPEKVLQNYYARMLKKLLPQYTNKHKSLASTAASNLIAGKPTARTVTRTKQTTPLKSSPQKPFKILDIRFDLKPPPPPPPSGASWSQGARYIYNTLPLDLTASETVSGSAQHSDLYVGLAPEDDEFQRWRNGHSLKRSPDFGRNLHVEYGFKPPLVPSVEIDDRGVPLNAGLVQRD